MKVGLSGGACSRHPTFPLRTPSGSVSFSGNISPQPNGILKFLLARNWEFESVSLQRRVSKPSVPLNVNSQHRGKSLSPEKREGRRRTPRRRARRPNLRIETEALATGVLLDGKRAVGVAYVQRGEAREARCSGEVILCAGAVKSPHLLELSGIGNPEILQSAGITVRHELRGVGENYRDHYAPRMNWRVTLPITLNEQTRGVALVKEIVKYYAQRRGVLSLAAALVHGFVRTGPELEVPDV